MSRIFAVGQRLWEALNKSILDFSRPSFQTRLYHPALAGTPPEDACMDAGGRAASGTKAEGNWNHLGHSFQMLLYHGSAKLAERPVPL